MRAISRSADRIDARLIVDAWQSLSVSQAQNCVGCGTTCFQGAVTMKRREKTRSDTHPSSRPGESEARSATEPTPRELKPQNPTLDVTRA